MQGSVKSDTPSFLGAHGEAASILRRFDWAKTPLGSPDHWPQSLKTAIRIMLTSRYAMAMVWGPELTFFCNDAYLPKVGIKRDWVLGSRLDKVWEEIWPEIGPRVRHVLTTGEATWDEGLLLFLERLGFPEETYHTSSYSPLFGDNGCVSGALCVVTEVTTRIIGERRWSSLSQLGAALATAHTEPQILLAAERGLRAAVKDIPFGLLYLYDERGQLHLTRAVGLPPGHVAAPAILTQNNPWPLTSDLVALGPQFGELPKAPWTRPPEAAVVMPISRQGQFRPAGLLVAALNPHRPYDSGYANFIELIAGQIGAALAGARVFEEERRRASALAEIDRAKTLFFSNVSHEFRTPLTLMLGPIEDALADTSENALTERQRERIALAHRNALRLLKLVNSLLDFSRIQSGRVLANFRQTDVCALTAELVSNFRSAIERANLSLHLHCEKLHREIFVDGDMWEKIVLNLVSNAFKFTFKGNITVKLAPSLDHSAAELVVRDTGVGIPGEEIPRLFERFHRVENQKGRSFEGSGIGLALVQELVRLHGGTIRIESIVGSGSQFTVSIPFGTSHLPPDQINVGGGEGITSIPVKVMVEETLQWLPEVERHERRSILPGMVPPEIGEMLTGGHVLVADDNADMRAYLHRLLGSHWQVEVTENGANALERIRHRKPDLLVTDAMMPVLDGFGLLKAIREDPALNDLSVIMLSARAGEEARIKGLEAGADYYLTKPFSGRELIAQVNANLKLIHLRRETTRQLRESAKELHSRTAQYETLLHRAPLGVYVVDADSQVVDINPTAILIFKVKINCLGRNFDEVMHNVWNKRFADEVIRRFRHTLNTGEPHISAEISELRADLGVMESYEWQLHRISMPSGRFGVVCYFRDISAQVRARLERDLLINELNHRVKNTLATIQFITAQTLAGAGVDRGVHEALEARLITMAGAHDVLTERNWDGADLHEIVSKALRPFADDQKMRVEGPSLHVAPAAALAIAMAVHELATNAVKYGSLSGGGQVRVSWRLDDDHEGGEPWLHIEWVESGGPPVNKPARKGFGSRLIGRGLASQLSGEASIEYARAGLVCRIHAPLSSVKGAPVHLS
jgi:signal transduction histidine kinase